MEFIQGKLSSVFRPMDFHGQRVAEQLLIRAVVFFAVLGFIVGYATGSFRHMVEINGVGLAIVSLLVLPPWPWYSKHSLTWLPDLNPTGIAKQ